VCDAGEVCTRPKRCSEWGRAFSTFVTFLLDGPSSMVPSYEGNMENAAVRPAELDRKRELDALSVLQSLHDGIDPATSQPLVASSSWNSVIVVRALATAIDALKRSTSRRIRPLPERVGAPWTQEEDRQLVESFDLGLPIGVLVGKHHRTRGAITARLERMGKLGTPHSQPSGVVQSSFNPRQPTANDRLPEDHTRIHLSPLHQLTSPHSIS
jgi:hypothetical protein